MGNSRNKIGLGTERNLENTVGFPSIRQEVPPFFSPQHRNSSGRGPFFDPVRVEHDRNRLRAEQQEQKIRVLAIQHDHQHNIKIKSVLEQD